MSPFRVTGSRPVCEAGFLRVEAVEVTGPGGERFTRTVVRHPGAVVVVPLRGRRALLVRQFRAALGGDLLEVPAGRRDVAGEPPAETARRELAEELGLRAGRLVELAEFHNSPGFCDEHSTLFVASELAEAAGAAACGPEEREMLREEVGLDDVERLVAARVLVDAKTIIGLLLARRWVDGVA